MRRIAPLVVQGRRRKLPVFSSKDRRAARDAGRLTFTLIPFGGDERIIQLKPSPPAKKLIDCNAAAPRVRFKIASLALPHKVLPELFRPPERA
jgi:hypothetical protein